jgi:hypothetical protein
MDLKFHSLSRYIITSMDFGTRTIKDLIYDTSILATNHVYLSKKIHYFLSFSFSSPLYSKRNAVLPIRQDCNITFIAFSLNTDCFFQIIRSP